MESSGDELEPRRIYAEMFDSVTGIRLPVN